MDAFVFTQKYNSFGTDLMVRLGNRKLCNARGRVPHGTEPTHICDAVGFHEGARNLRRIHEIRQPVFEFDNGLTDEIPHAQRRRAIFQALAQMPEQSLDLIAYFGHGIREGLESAGIFGDHLIQFKELTEKKCKPNATVVFYACLTGAPGGFANKLAEMLNPALNIWVYGHTGAGHYANIGMFRKFPGNQRLSRSYEERLCLSFWRRERAHASQAH